MGRGPKPRRGDVSPRTPREGLTERSTASPGDCHCSRTEARRGKRQSAGSEPGQALYNTASGIPDPGSWFRCLRRVPKAAKRRFHSGQPPNLPFLHTRCFRAAHDHSLRQSLASVRQQRQSPCGVVPHTARPSRWVRGDMSPRRGLGQRPIPLSLAATGGRQWRWRGRWGRPSGCPVCRRSDRW